MQVLDLELPAGMSWIWSYLAPGARSGGAWWRVLDLDIPDGSFYIDLELSDAR